MGEVEDWLESSFGSALEKMFPMLVQGVSAVRALMKYRVVAGMREEMKDTGDCQNRLGYGAPNRTKALGDEGDLQVLRRGYVAATTRVCGSYDEGMRQL